MKRALLFAGLLLVGCGSTTGPGVGEEFELGVGERVTLADAGLFIRFIEVTEDSRCPSQLQCVSPGDAAVLLEIAPVDGDAFEVTLHTTLEPRFIVLGSIVLRLLRLDPYPETPGSILPDQYVVTLSTDATVPLSSA